MNCWTIDFVVKCDENTVMQTLRSPTVSRRSSLQPEMNPNESILLTIDTPELKEAQNEEPLDSRESNSLLTSTCQPIPNQLPQQTLIVGTSPATSAMTSPNENSIKNSRNEIPQRPHDDKWQCLVCKLGSEPDYTLECFDCKMSIHYNCTNLPLYQLYFLGKSTRRYTCESCCLSNHIKDTKDRKWIADAKTSMQRHSQLIAGRQDENATPPFLTTIYGSATNAPQTTLTSTWKSHWAPQLNRLVKTRKM